MNKQFKIKLAREILIFSASVSFIIILAISLFVYSTILNSKVRHESLLIRTMVNISDSLSYKYDVKFRQIKKFLLILNEQHFDKPSSIQNKHNFNKYPHRNHTSGRELTLEDLELLFESNEKNRIGYRIAENNRPLTNLDTLLYKKKLLPLKGLITRDSLNTTLSHKGLTKLEFTYNQIKLDREYLVIWDSLFHGKDHLTSSLPDEVFDLFNIKSRKELIELVQTLCISPIELISNSKANQIHLQIAQHYDKISYLRGKIYSHKEIANIIKVISIALFLILYPLRFVYHVLQWSIRTLRQQ